MQKSPAKIVVVEDNPADVYLLRQALAERGEAVELTLLSDGEQALRFVEEQRISTEPTPCVILLDLHLPREDGTTVLRAIAHEPALEHVRVAVWTGLASPDERAEALRYGADLYQLKPDTLDGFWELAARLIDLCHGHSLEAAQ